MSVLVVSGWRGPLTEEQRFLVRLEVGNMLYNVRALYHGGATGVDAVAASDAEGAGVRAEAFPAEWLRYGPRAGPERNKLMLETAFVRAGHADGIVVLAFPHPTKSRGTWDCVRQAAAMGITSHVYPLPAGDDR